MIIVLTLIVLLFDSRKITGAVTGGPFLCRSAPCVCVFSPGLLTVSGCWFETLYFNCWDWLQLLLLP